MVKMVSSRHRTSTASLKDTSIQEKEWTVREKLYLASLALKHNNAWNTVARQMQPYLEKDQPVTCNQKTCAAQFDKLMNELGVDKRPKRNETTDATGSVIYKKMAEKRMKELEANIIKFREEWLKACDDLKAAEQEKEIKPEPATTGKQRGKQQQQQPTPTSKASITTSKVNTSVSAKVNTSISSEPEKTTTRAHTRRQNLKDTFSALYQKAMELKELTQLGKPSSDVEKTLGSYDKVILQHVDMNTIKKKFTGDIEDPHALMNDFLLMFQNATMYYPVDHPTFKLATELREKLVPHWEKQIFERPKARH